MKEWHHFLLLILVATEIFFVSSIPGSSIKTLEFPYIDTAYHFTSYFLLGFFSLSSLIFWRKPKAKFLAIAIIFCLCYAFLDELHQSFVPGRDASIGDFLTDSAGAIAGILMCIFTFRKKERKRKKERNGILKEMEDELKELNEGA